MKKALRDLLRRRFLSRLASLEGHLLDSDYKLCHFDRREKSFFRGNYSPITFFSSPMTSAG